MPSLKWLLLFAASFYLGLVALMYVAQRYLMYMPSPVRIAPAAAGLSQAEEAVLDTADGERVIVWHVPAHAGRPVVIYFHGNGGALHHLVERFRELSAEGWGLVALSYRGYSGSTGRPSETGLLHDGAAAYAFATARYPVSRLVLWGESLGSGVAVALAAEQPVACLVLEAPFSSAVDIAASAYPYVPVRLLMKDQFRSDERIGRVTAPVLVLHGDADRVVPIWSGERLYERIKAPKRLVRFPGGRHEDLWSHGALAQARQFVAEMVK